MESKKPEEVSTDSTLPPSFEESCRGEGDAALSHHAGSDHCLVKEQTVALEASPDDGPLPEKSQLTDIPPTATQTAMIYNTDSPPPYEADPLRQAVWSTEASKLYPGRPRMVSRDNGRVNVVCCRLIVILSAIAGLYLGFEGFSSIVANDETARRLIHTLDEVRELVTEVPFVDKIPDEYEGKLVHVVGPLSVDTLLEYDECDVTVLSVKLRRMYDRSHIYNRDGDKPYFFSGRWPQTRLGFDQVCTGSGSPWQRSFSVLRDEEKIVPEAKIGAFTLGHRLKEKFDEYVLVSDKLLEVGPTQAIRVMYSESGRDGRIYSVMGQLVNGTIEPYYSTDFYNIILQAEFSVSAEAMAEDRVNFRMKQLEEENRWSYATIVLGILIPLIAILRYEAVLKATKKHKPNDVMLSSQLM